MSRLLGKGKKNQWVVFLLVGLIFLVIGIPTEKSENVVQEMEETVSSAEKDKAEILEEKLEKVLSQVSGVGRTKVLITLKSDGKKLVEKDETASSKVTSDVDTSQGSSTIQENFMEAVTIYEKSGDGQESPYVTEQVEPEVLGVLVVAEGGGDAQIVSQITEAVQALFSIEVHKIKVMKMN